MEAYINDVETLLISLSKQNEILNRNILELYTRIENIENRLSSKIKDEDKRRINMEFMKIIKNNKKHESNVIP